MTRICVIGMFPPPVNGMALVTEHVARGLPADDASLTIDCSPRTYRLRGLGARFSKLLRQFGRFARFARWAARGPGGTLYLALSGGWGQAYDVVFIALARMFGARLYLHHHGYAYIDRHSGLTATLVRAAGPAAVHVVACERMGVQLQAEYPGVRAVRVVSGVVCLPAWSPPARLRGEVRRVGFISNVSREKGIDEFLALAERLPALDFRIAGQFQDERSRARVEDACARNPNLQYVGPKYDDDKRDFFDAIDVLAFPTHTESEGLVIHEAASRGVPVIAPDRGCIASVLSATPGFVCGPGEDYVEFAAARLAALAERPEELAAASADALRAFDAARAAGAVALRRLHEEIAGPRGPGAANVAS